jgi:Protein of unknown function (DUF2971)
MLLYHYCSAQTFIQIVGSVSIRLSSLAQSNDSMEGKLVSESIARLGAKDTLSSAEIERMQVDFRLMEDLFGGLGFCLSEEGDLLSQWRGYAADGTGVSIGFAKDYLEELIKTDLSTTGAKIVLEKVEYDRSAQDDLVHPAYSEIKSRMKNSAWQYPTALAIGAATGEERAARERASFAANMNISLVALSLLEKLYLLKSSGFREEREWRLLAHKLKGSLSVDNYRATGDQIIPFTSLKLRSLSHPRVSRVVLGPKHRSPTNVVREFLQKAGFPEVEVVTSESTYR